MMDIQEALEIEARGSHSKESCKTIAAAYRAEKERGDKADAENALYRLEAQDLRSSNSPWWAKWNSERSRALKAEARADALEKELAETRHKYVENIMGKQSDIFTLRAEKDALALEAARYREHLKEIMEQGRLLASWADAVKYKNTASWTIGLREQVKNYARAYEKAPNISAAPSASLLEAKALRDVAEKAKAVDESLLNPTSFDLDLHESLARLEAVRSGS